MREATLLPDDDDDDSSLGHDSQDFNSREIMTHKSHYSYNIFIASVSHMTRGSKPRLSSTQLLAVISKC